MQMLCDGKIVHLWMDDAGQNSMLITGRSRMGKTFFVSNFAADLQQNGYTVQLIDLGDKWSKADKERLQAAGAVLHQVAKQGLELTFATTQELAGCVRFLVSALGFRSANANSVLRKVLLQLVKESEGAFSLDEVLEQLKICSEPGNPGSEWAGKLSERFESFSEMPDILFFVKEIHENSDKGYIWDLSGLDDTYVRIVASLISYHLFCQQKRLWRSQKKRKIFLIIDEFQNLEIDRQSIIGTCLTEGQKYGMNLILLTQFLAGNFSEAVLHQFKQGGFRFYFRLTEEEAAVLSAQLAYNTEQRKRLYQRLRQLPRGHCLMLGLHTIGNRKEISESIRFIEISE